MKTKLKNLVYGFLSRFDFSGTVVLMYHSVGNNREFFTVRTEEFERQMAYLKKNGFEVVRLIDIFSEPSKKKRVAITFDDGYRDNFLNAFPILATYGFPATIFVTSGRIGQAIKARQGTVLPVLSSEEMKQMAQGGLIDFGSHTHEHIDPRLMDEDEVEDDLARSQREISAITGRETESIAYPKGILDGKMERAVQRHFKIGCLTQKGRVCSDDDPFRIKRNSIDREVNFKQFKGIVKFGRL